MRSSLASVFAVAVFEVGVRRRCGVRFRCEDELLRGADSRRRTPDAVLAASSEWRSPKRANPATNDALGARAPSRRPLGSAGETRRALAGDKKPDRAERRTEKVDGSGPHDGFRWARSIRVEVRAWQNHVRGRPAAARFGNAISLLAANTASGVRRLLVLAAKKLILASKSDAASAPDADLRRRRREHGRERASHVGRRARRAPPGTRDRAWLPIASTRSLAVPLARQRHRIS